METETTYQEVKSSELKQGDVVITHGMIVELDRPVRELETGQYGPGFACRGRVTNFEEVNLSDPWLGQFVQSDHRPEDGEDIRWTIQGNDNALWLTMKNEVEMMETPRQRWGTCCPSDPECEHSLLDTEELSEWMDTPISDEQAQEYEPFELDNEPDENDEPAPGTDEYAHKYPLREDVRQAELWGGTE